MAGMEQVEIHSKSYIVRWIKVEEKHSISWSIQPHKKSINFGIFKHPGHAGSLGSSTDEHHTSSSLLSTPLLGADAARRPSSQNDASTAQEELRSKGFIPVLWHGKCEPDKVCMGQHAVAEGQGGMYGLIFDNTFSRAMGKTATIVLLTYPTAAPPQGRHMAAAGLASSMGLPSPGIGSAQGNDSVDSLHSIASRGTASRGTSTSRGDSGVRKPEPDYTGSIYHVGVLQKRRRKKGQGYARRYFSLDFASCTLSYYYNRGSSALRGAIPLSLAAITADARRREINIDSGAEVWHLKANNAKDFAEWTRALQKASSSARGTADDVLATPRIGGPQEAAVETNTAEHTEWEQVEALVSRIVGTRDAVRRLSKDTAPKKHASSGLGLPIPSSSVGSDTGDYFSTMMEQKRPFWKRKSSAPATPPIFQRGLATQLAVPVPGSITSNTGASSPGITVDEQDMHQHCTALLNDLDTVLEEFGALLAKSKQRRLRGSQNNPRRSTDSAASERFYDAEDHFSHSQFLEMEHHSETGSQASDGEPDSLTDAESISSASTSDEESAPPQAANFPCKAKSLEPLPLASGPKRRKTLPPAAGTPPSLIAFFRKNVGKDLSTISVPAAANEPISLVQRFAEQLEYAGLLDNAAAHQDSTRRLLIMTAFAVSQFSPHRHKERAVRKPFNPLLGETFELVRSSDEVPGGFRMLVEKVSHRPVRLAMHADAEKWSYAHSPAPTQKFWGKSAELNTDGRVRIVLHLPEGKEELYSFSIATVFLRNVVMGEKYVEPVGTMTIACESSGAKAQVEFRAKGMFGGRSEDVFVEALDAGGHALGHGLQGTWTQELHLTEHGKKGETIWRVGDLVNDPAKRYGLTVFAAGLNEITAVEQGKLPPTDSRLRRDQRWLEEGRVDEAEAEKARLEEAQRRRRKEMEGRGEEHVARWFTRIPTPNASSSDPSSGGGGGGGGNAATAEEIWRIKTGRESYWDERARGKWDGVLDILA